MKKAEFVFLILLSFLIINCKKLDVTVYDGEPKVEEFISIYGKVLYPDGKTGIPGISVALSDEKTGLIDYTDALGNYCISNIPKEKFRETMSTSIYVNYYGKTYNSYNEISKTINLNVTSREYNFILGKSFLRPKFFNANSNGIILVYYDLNELHLNDINQISQLWARVQYSCDVTLYQIPNNIIWDENNYGVLTESYVENNLTPFFSDPNSAQISVSGMNAISKFINNPNGTVILLSKGSWFDSSISVGDFSIMLYYDKFNK